MEIFSTIKIDVFKDFSTEYYVCEYDLSSSRYGESFRAAVKPTVSFKTNTDQQVAVRVRKPIAEIEARKIAFKKLMESKWFKKNKGDIISNLRKRNQMARDLATDLVAFYKNECLEDRYFGDTTGFYR